MAKIINCTRSKDYDELYLYVISDVHIGSPQFQMNKFKKMIDEINSVENSIVILLGDILDNAIVGGKSDVYTQVLTPSQQLQLASQLLSPIKDKIVTVTSGNHENRTTKQVGFDLSEALAVELVGRDKANEIYSQNPFLLFVEFGKNNGRDNRKTIYSIYGRHGMAGGSTVGAKANQLSKTGEMIPNVDLVLHAHTHLPLIYKDTSSNVDYRNKKINTKVRTFVNSNAFLDQGSYAEGMALKPSAIVYPKIILNGDHREVTVVL